jgi:CheY-like chemotaxis protein
VARILVMESNDSLRELFTEGLAGEGYEVHAVARPAEALALLPQQPVDLILTGLVAHAYAPEVLAPVAALSRAAPAIPLVLTADFPEIAHLNPTDYGVSAILMQPFDLDLLLSEVREALAR